MKYEKIVKAKFISRPNRFVAIVNLNGEEVSVHVKNTGRCKELLVSGAAVYLEDFTCRQGKRKYLYDLVAVEKGNLLINMDSQAPNKAAREALINKRIQLPGMSDILVIKPSTQGNAGRLDKESKGGRDRYRNRKQRAGRSTEPSTAAARGKEA